MRRQAVGSINLAQSRNLRRALVNTVINHQVSYNSRNLLTSWMTISFSRKALLPTVSYLVKRVSEGQNQSVLKVSTEEKFPTKAMRRSSCIRRNLGHMSSVRDAGNRSPRGGALLRNRRKRLHAGRQDGACKRMQLALQQKLADDFGWRTAL